MGFAPWPSCLGLLPQPQIWFSAPGSLALLLLSPPLPTPTQQLLPPSAFSRNLGVDAGRVRTSGRTRWAAALTWAGSATVHSVGDFATAIKVYCLYRCRGCSLLGSVGWNGRPVERGDWLFCPEGWGRGKGARCFDPKADGRGSLEVRRVSSVE